MSGGLATTQHAELLTEIRAVVGGRDPHAAVRSERTRMLHRFAEDGSAGRITDFVLNGTSPADRAGWRASPVSRDPVDHLSLGASRYPAQDG